MGTYRLRTSVRNIYSSAHSIGIANAAISLWYKCVSTLSQESAQNLLQRSRTPPHGPFIQQLMSRKPLCPCKETNCSARPLLSAPVLDMRHRALLTRRKKSVQLLFPESQSSSPWVYTNRPGERLCKAESESSNVKVILIWILRGRYSDG
jgi:hypothetical protein